MAIFNIIAANGADELRNAFPYINRFGNLIAMDSDGNRYLAGLSFSDGDGTDANMGFGTNLAPTYDDYSMVVIQIRANNTFGWVQSVGGNDSLQPCGLAVDGGRVYLLIRSSSPTLFVGQPQALTGTGVTRTVIVALNAVDGSVSTGFGSNGQQFISTSEPVDIAASGGVVYTLSYHGSSATSFQLGTDTPVAAFGGNQNAVVAALDGSTGQGVAGFGSAGLQLIGSQSTVTPDRLTLTSTHVYAAGSFRGNQLGVGALGTVNAAGTDVFLAALERSTGAGSASFGSGGVRKIDGNADLSSVRIAQSDGTLFVSTLGSATTFQVGATSAGPLPAGFKSALLALQSTTGEALTTFGSNGALAFGSPHGVEIDAIAADGGSVYLTGDFTNLAPLAIAAGDGSVFVAALNATDGALRTTFGSGGVQTIGSPDGTTSGRLHIAATALWVSGSGQEGIAVGGMGEFSNGNFLIPLDKTSGAFLGAAMTSPSSRTVVAGQSFSHTFTATHSITNLNVLNLPPGLTLAGRTLSGIPTKLGETVFKVSATANGVELQLPFTLNVIQRANSLLRPPLVQGGDEFEFTDARDQGMRMARNAAGETFLAGRISTIEDFNPGAGVALHGARAGLVDLFVTKYNADGSYAWTQTVGAAGSDTLAELLVDGSSLYLVGTASGADVQIGSNPVVPLLGGGDGFVAALNTMDGSPRAGFGTNGVVVLGGSKSDACHAAVLGDGALFLSGKYSSVNFGIGGGSAAPFGTDSASCFVAALNASNGGAITGFGTNGIVALRTTNSGYATALHYSDTRLYVGGSTNHQLTLGNAPQITSAFPPGTLRAFIAALNPANGTPDATFGTSGAQFIGGSTFEEISNLLVVDSTLYAIVDSQSSNVGIGAVGTFSAGFRGSCLVAMNLNGSPKAGFGFNGLIGLGSETCFNPHSLFVLSGRIYAAVVPDTSLVVLNIPGTGIKEFRSRNGSISSYLFAFDPATGALDSTFGKSGGLEFSASSVQLECAGALLGKLVAVGAFYSGSTTKLQFGDYGSYSSIDGFNGFLAEFDADGRPEFPALLGPRTISGVQGQALNFTVQGTHPILSLSAASLPDGLTVQGSAIVGTPKNSGTSSVELRAVMAAGDVRDSITIRIQGDSIGRFLPQIQASDVSSSRGRTLTRDAQNNLYYVSVLSNDTRDYNLGVGADVVSELGPALVVTRINSNGTYGWSQKVTGVTTVGGLAVSDSSVYVLSYTSSPVQIGIGNTTQKLTVNDDAFIAALDNATGAARSGFGTNGIQILTSSGDDRVFDGVVVGNTLYVTGSFDGINFGIGAPGALSSTTTTGYVAALNATSGTAVSAFGASGIQRIVSSSRTNGYFIVSSSGALYVAGEFNGNGLGIGAAGTLNSIGSTDVYVAGLVQDTGAALPGFGTSGVIRIGSSGAESVYGLEVGGETLYAVGNFSGSGLGIGAAGSVNSVGGTNTFLAAVSKATGLSLGTFGTAGLQTVGGANTFNTRLAVGNGGVYLAGTFNSNTLGIGGAGTFATSGSEDAFIAALHLETGQALTSFGTNGLQKVGGSSFDRSNSVVTTPGKIWSFLVSSSFNLGVGGVGTYSITPNGYLFPLDPATGQTPLIPTLLITSATASSGAQHVPFANYTITASEALVSSSATGLPPGLTLAGHIISGTPQSIGEFNVQLSATGVRGQVAAATLKITVTGDRIAATFPPLFAAAHALDTLRLTFDAAGNRYVTGRFSTTLDFNPGPGADSRQPNGLDVFVTRFNADGSYAWTSLIGGSGSDYARGIATDGTRVYVCGEQGGPNFGINGTNTLGGVLHNSQVFVACLDATNGSAVASFGNSGLQSINGSFVYARDLLLTPNGVVVAGSFGTTPSTGLRVGQTTTTRIASDSSNGFVLRLNPFTGALDTSFGPDGVRVVAGSSSDVVSTLSYNTGVLYCAGDFFSRNMGLEIPGEFFSQATDGFVFALNEANGAILTDFGRNGIQSIVGSDSESILAMAVQGGRLFVAGKSQSINLGIGKIGNGFAGDPDDDDESSAFIAALDATTGQAISGFGTNGLVIERVPGEQDFSVLRIAGGSVYALQRQGAIYQLGGASSTNYLSLLCEYDATTGAVGTHLAGGKMLLDGNMADYGRDLALHGSTLWIAGTTGSTDFCGKWRAQDGFNGFMIPVDVTGMPPPPALEGPFDLYATVGVPFNYTPMFEGGGDAQTATYSALPAGLSQEDVSITGTPALSGDYEVSATISVAVSGYTVKTILRIHVRGNETANTSLPLVRGGGSAVRIASDAQNNLYVAGTFSDQRDFNPGSGADLKQASGTDDLFVTRFNADGSYAWTHVFSSPGDDELSALVVADATVFVAGAQNNNQALPGAPGLPTFPFRDGVVFALNSASGQPRAGFTPVRLIGNADTIVNAIAVRNGTLFTVGTFSSSNLNNGSLENVASRGGSDVFFSKFNASTGGQLSTFSGVRSFVTFGGSNTETATSLCVTDTTVYVGGVFNSPNAGLGGYGGAVTLQDSSFILKLDPVSGAADPSFGIDGILKLGSTGVTRLSALLLRSGILYAGGSYSGILGLNDFEVLIVMGQGASDGFVAALDAVSGENVTSFGQNGFTSIGGSGTDAVLALHEHDGTLAAAGVFASPNFGVTQPGDLIALPTALSGVRSNDGFVARLNLETGAKTAATIFHSSSPGTENAQSLAVVNGTLHAAGYADQASVVINGRGPYDARGWNAYIAPVVEPTQPNLPPLITQGVQLDFVRAEDSGVLSFGLDASDPEAQTIVWSIVGGDGQLVLGTQSNQGQHAEFSFTPQLNQTGSVVFSVRATDSEGASDTILIRVTLTPQNDAPVFTSGISATPNPATIGTVVQFSALATDPDGTAPVITWDFGDGAQAIGATASHAYVSGGVYVVTVTVNDGQGGVIIDALTLSVIPHAGPDSDNDGFNDDVEIAAGSDPNDSSSTPFGALPDQSEFLQGASLRITLQFPPAPTGRDAIRLKCLLPVAGNFAPAQTELLVNVGGVMRRLVHDVKGRVKMPAEKSTLSKRSSRTGMATLNVAFTGSFAEKLSGYGLTAPKAKGSAKVPVEVLMGRTYFKATPTLKYSSNGKKGSAR